MSALRIAFAAAFVLLATCVAAPAATPVRVALVIGNGAYTAVPALPSPVGDAAAIGQALRDVGFTEVTVATDLTHPALFEALRRFAAESAKADWAVLYYAGHGIEVGGRNYLVPVDAHLVADRDVDFEAVPMETVLAAVGGARQLRLVILDACRDNPFLQRMARSTATRSIDRGLARVAPEGDLYLVYSAKSGQVAVDGGAGHSPFVAALLRNIETPGLEINLLFRRVHADVKAASEGRQEPDFEGTLPADELFFEAPAAGREPAPVPPVADAPAPRVPVPDGAVPAAPVAARPQTAAVDPAQPAARAYAYVAGLDPGGDNFLALKAGPDIKAPRLIKMGPGTLLTITGRAGPWAHVELRSGETGWAFGRYLACCRSP